MFDFLRRAIGKHRSPGSSKRTPYDELVRQGIVCQLQITELNRKIEKQQQHLREVLERGKRENSEIAKLDLAEQYSRGERQVRRLFDLRKTLVKAQELVEVQRINIELQNAIPEEILRLNRPEAHREKALADVVRDRLNLAYEEMRTNLESTALDRHSEMLEKAETQAVLDLFESERDVDLSVTLRAIEKDLDAVTGESLFTKSDQRLQNHETITES